MSEGELREVWGGTNHCEQEGCHFAIRFENCLSEDEAIAVMTATSIAHYQSMHPGKMVDLDFVVEENKYEQTLRNGLPN